MSRVLTSTAADYAGRAVDLACYWSDDWGNPRVPLTQALAGPDEGGRLVTGLWKVAQQFLIVLFTEAGSLRFDPGFGTAFMTQARLGRWRTAADVRQAFTSAVVDVRRQLKAKERDEDPDDERFAQATLKGVELAGDRVSLRVDLLTEAGESAAFIAPVPLVIR